MKTPLLLAAFGLALTFPALAQATTWRNHGMSRHSDMRSSTSTTPSVNRPSDADMRSANRKGGTGGKNSSSNGS